MDLKSLLKSFGLKPKMFEEDEDGKKTCAKFSYPSKTNTNFYLVDREGNKEGEECLFVSKKYFKENKEAVTSGDHCMYLVYNKDTFTDYFKKVVKQMIEQEESGIVDPSSKYCNYIETIGKKTISGMISKIHYSEYDEASLVGYVRVSTPKQLEGESIDAQEDLIYKEAERRQKKIRAIYFDCAKKGGKTNSRHGLNKLLEDMKKDDIIIFPSLTRFIRNTKLFLDISDRIIKTDADAYYLDYPDLSYRNPTAKMILTIIASFGELENAMTASRVKTVQAYMEENGRLLKKPSYGYKVVKDENGVGTIVEDEKEMKAIECIRDTVSKYKNCSYGVIKKDLKDKKIDPLRHSKKWASTAIARIMEANDIKFQKNFKKVEIIGKEVMVPDEETKRKSLRIRKNDSDEE